MPASQALQGQYIPPYTHMQTTAVSVEVGSCPHTLSPDTDLISSCTRELSEFTITIIGEKFENRLGLCNRAEMFLSVNNMSRKCFQNQTKEIQKKYFAHLFLELLIIFMTMKHILPIMMHNHNNNNKYLYIRVVFCVLPLISAMINIFEYELYNC